MAGREGEGGRRGSYALTKKRKLRRAGEKREEKSWEKGQVGQTFSVIKKSAVLLRIVIIPISQLVSECPMGPKYCELSTQSHYLENIQCSFCIFGDFASGLYSRSLSCN